MKKIISLIYLFFLNTYATTYYVSPSGSDTNSGTSVADAWQTIAHINTINFQPGDIILFEGGSTFTGNIYIESTDGNSASSPLQISSYGTGKATIDAGNNFGIYVYNSQGVIIDNLIIQGSGLATNTNSGILFYADLPGDVKLDNIQIRNCEVFGFGLYGIAITSYANNTGYSNVLIDNNEIHDCLDKGITSSGFFSQSKLGYSHSTITVRNCHVYNIPGSSAFSGHSGNGIVLSDVDDSVIEYCTVHNCGSGNASCGGPVGIWYWDSNDVIIQYCEVYQMSNGTGCDGAGFDLDGGVTNGIMQYNYSHDNEGPGYLIGQFQGSRAMQNITMRYNISENDSRNYAGSIFLFNGEPSLPMANIDIYNNTIYLSESVDNTGSEAVYFLDFNPINQNINFQNNIFYVENNADLISIPAGAYSATFKGNAYYTTAGFNINYNGNNYTSLTDFQQNANQEMDMGSPVGFQGNPLLTNPGNGGIIGFGNDLHTLTAYQLTGASPVIDSGMNLMLSSFEDFYGNTTIQNGTDIGAHEFDSNTLAIDDFHSAEQPMLIYESNCCDTKQIKIYNIDKETINKMVIYNIYGQQILTKINNDISLEVNIEEYASGTYIMQLEVDNEILAFKFFKK
ncbi:MAG: T9SS type A sorting domain-containing protein [Kordia sp.]|uniref:right-handed parallel beta-helix repeat-containing protein n=1 Tax=Kordia sp. TaxID=1965332 RepID=UPI00385CB9D6